MFQVGRAFASLFGDAINFPSVQEARWLTDRMKYSPDYGWLEQFEYQLLFSPDDTKQNHSHHCLIEDSAFVATAYTTHSFNYWCMEAGEDRIPIPMQNDNPKHTIRYFPPPLKIQGEIHAVRPYEFLGLDTYKRNGVQFQRKRVNLILPYREILQEEYIFDGPTDYRPLPMCLKGKKGALTPEKVYIIRAWMYIAMPEYWDNLLDGGFRGFKTVNYYESRRPWLKEYYVYRK
jgi:hypothetical protein